MISSGYIVTCMHRKIDLVSMAGGNVYCVLKLSTFMKYCVMYFFFIYLFNLFSTINIAL